MSICLWQEQCGRHGCTQWVRTLHMYIFMLIFFIARTVCNYTKKRVNSHTFRLQRVQILLLELRHCGFSAKEYRNEPPCSVQSSRVENSFSGCVVCGFVSWMLSECVLHFVRKNTCLPQTGCTFRTNLHIKRRVLLVSVSREIWSFICVENFFHLTFFPVYAWNGGDIIWMHSTLCRLHI